ncbi:MAG: hypothetical protein JNK15_00255 [Planctomycetes bacterium]|nr:hypothetical protein [Planctomycetota bacterium]
MPTSPAATGDRLLHCSPARTVFERVDATRGETVVGKVYVTGSHTDAEHECAMGQLAGGEGVVRHLATATDPGTGRPMVLTAKAAGSDLGRIVAARGALPAADACALLAPVATTLARLHAIGICHGDVKPRNLLQVAAGTLLLDFEHAARFGDRSGRAVGTVGFAAPEAAHAAAGPALDVFALGRTLRWLLTGGIEARVPLAPRVQDLLAACTAADPARRPNCVDVAATLRELEVALADDAHERLWQDAATGAFAVATVADDDVDPRAVAWRQRRALLARVPRLLAGGSPTAGEPAAVRAALLHTTRVLRRFPRHAGMLQWRTGLQQELARMLHEAARHIAASTKAETFLPAASWLVDAEVATRHALALPGGIPLPDGEQPANAHLLHRDPLAHLQRLGAKLAAARAELHEQTDAVDRAVQALDLAAAEQAVDTMAAGHGGASPTVARLRDQLHRLGFYLDRIGRGAPNVDRLTEAIEPALLAPLQRFLDVATRGPNGQGASEARATVGLRSLQLTLANLAEEFPRLGGVRPAVDALTAALVHVTEHAHTLLADARQRLQAIPIPVRPLQLTLGRLDSFRILEAFVDRPDRPRSHLLDGIESLRLSLDQARASRDRLTESAESAIARGHWTTGLFEMERAVAGLGPDADQEQEEATRLQARLADAKRRKQEVEATERRNVEIATRYGMLQDDPGSTFEARLQALEERRDCLTFLSMHVPSERGALYQRDLREVETQIALERAGLAEHQLDGTTDPAGRLQVVRATLDQLAASVAPNERGQEAPGRLVRLVDHWRTLAEQCQRAVDQRHAERTLRARHKRRVVLALLVAVVATTAAVTFAVRPWLQGTPALANGR